MKKLRDYVASQLYDHEFPIFRGPVFLITHFRIPAPSSYIEKRRKMMHCWPHPARPDGDNLEKFLNDALNGIIWSDDARIAWNLRSKTYTRNKSGEIILFARSLVHACPDYNMMMQDIYNHIQLEEPCDLSLT